MKRHPVVLIILMTAASLFAGACQPTKPDHPPSPRDPVAEFYRALEENEAARAGERWAIEAVIVRRFPGEEGKALRVANCETGGTLNPHVTNGQYLGLWQLGAHHYWRFDGYGGLHLWSDPVTNTDVARDLRHDPNGTGWGPWQCQ